MIVAEFIKDYWDTKKIIHISKGSTFRIDDSIFVSPLGLHMGSIILLGSIPVIPSEYYILKYEYHYVNNPPGYNESVFDICDAVDELVEIARDPNADVYILGEAGAWIVQNYCDMKRQRDSLRQNVKNVESKIYSNPSNPPIWDGWFKNKV